MSNAPCPLCGQPKTEPQDICICGACDHALRTRDTAPVHVHATGEFTVAQVLQAAEAQVAEPVKQTSVETGITCSWCGKLGAHVKKMLSQSDVLICNECVALCSDILAAELGDGWRG